MITKQVFNLGVNWRAEKKSLRHASIHFLGLLKALYEISDLFSMPIFSKENQKDVSFSIDKLSDNNAVDLISNTILEFSRYDIGKYEKEQNPTIDYSRDFGFSFVLTYRKEDKEISFLPRIGSSEACGINMLSYRGDGMTFRWCYLILKALVSGSEATKGSVGIRDLPFQKACKDVIAPLGWITYFSNDFTPLIPNDLDGIEYEFTDKGKYLILTREDFTLDKSNHEVYKQKLLNIMMEIKRREPKYSK